MGDILTVVTIGKVSGIPEDNVQNSFAFHVSGGPGSAEGDNITERLAHFYNDPGSTGTNPIRDYLARSIDADVQAVKLQHYNITGHLEGDPHGAPYYETSFALTNTAETALPDEIACVLSFNSSYGSDVEFGAGGTRPRARDRGRIYIGPLATNTLTTASTTHEVMFEEDFLTDVVAAASDLKGDLEIVWSVWSRVDAVLKPVVHIWADNAVDVQRRRGTKATARFQAS